MFNVIEVGAESIIVIMKVNSADDLKNIRYYD